MLTSGTQNGVVHGAGVRLGNSARWSSGREVRREEEEGKLVRGAGVSAGETGEAGVERARAVRSLSCWLTLARGPGSGKARVVAGARN